MKNTFKAIFLFSLLILSQPLSAQYQIGLVPRSSPDREIYQKVGLTDIRIKYGSPSVKDRNIWGGLVPYNKVWRAGANHATTVEFSTDVEMEGQMLPKGIYSFFLIPQKEQKWIAIFNKIPKQWGAFSYKEEEDALRLEIDAGIKDDFQERLIYEIVAVNFNTAYLELSWENIKIRLKINTQYIKQFVTAVEERADQAAENIKWVVYLQGAEHLWEMKDSLALADTWIQKSKKLSQQLEEWNTQYYPKEYIQGHLHWLSAQLYQDKNERDEVCSSLKKVKSSTFYSKRKEEINRIIGNWKLACEED